MLQKKPLHEWTSRDLEEWREKLSELIILVYKAGNTRQARQILEDYKEGKLAFHEAKEKLLSLVAKTKAKT